MEFVPRRFWWAQLGGWTLLGTLAFALTESFMREIVGATLVEVAIRTAMWAGAGFVVSSALLFPYRGLLDDPVPTWRRVVGIGVCSVAAALLWAGAMTLTSWPLPEDPAEAIHRREPDRPAPSPLGIAVPQSLLLFTWSGILLGYRNAERLTSAREAALRSEALLAEARLEMLRYELNPHFLFNALNSVIGAIDEDPRKAQRMVLGLSELLRNTLRAGDGDVPLADELEIIRTYLAIEHARFEERLQVTWDIPEAVLARRVPSMSIHLLVENAVKHGMETSKMPLNIHIAAGVAGRRWWIEVTNSGKLRPTRADGIGLRNLRERLEHRYPERHQFRLDAVDGTVRARVELEDE